MACIWDSHFILNMRTRFNNRKNYDDIFSQFKFVIENMRNPLNGLYISMQWIQAEKHSGVIR